MRARFALLALPVLVGCSAGGGGVSFTATSSSSSSGSTAGTGGSTGSAGTGGAGTGGSTAGTGGSSTSSSSSGVLFDAGPIPDSGPPVVAEVFGHSAGTLYKLDPVTKVVTTVGDFTGGCNTVIDIALDKDGNMFATTPGSVYRVDKTTAVCTLIGSFGAYPNSLSFVPKGTVLPNEEALVGYDPSGRYIRIDTTNGAITVVNATALQPKGYTSSGDIVSVINGGTYLTVLGGDCTSPDCIVQVDPKTGAVLNKIGKLTHSSVYGLAFWGGSAYGFSADGKLFQIDRTNGNCTNIPIPNRPAGYVWYGAGSSTSAPLTPTQ